MSKEQSTRLRFFEGNSQSGAANYELDREEAMRVAREKMRQYDQSRMQAARDVFDNKAGLQELIEAEIYPTVVMLKTASGVVGTGFFQHSQWLVSNAHIVPCREVIDVARIIDFRRESLPLEAECSYHRPSERDDSPDVVIIKTDSRRNNKCLQTQFTLDECYDKTCIFYVAPSLHNSGHYEVKFLRPCSKQGTYPLIYECEDGSVPQPGCSGSPIIQARVATDHEPKWQFKVIGALYARCSPIWYDANPNAERSNVSDNTKLVCAIPIIQEFSHVLEIIRGKEYAIREGQMAAACKSLGDDQGKRDALRYLAMSHASTNESRERLLKFENGDTVLNISLPDGLEKLWYRTVVAVEDSLLIEKVRSRELGRKNVNNFSNVPSVAVEDLQTDFALLIEKISSDGDIKLQSGDRFYTSPDGYFRIDVGVSNNDWMLDIQDNTGKYKFNNQSLSSKFAIVKIPKDHNPVDGVELAALFRESQDRKETIDVSSRAASAAAARLRRK